MKLKNQLENTVKKTTWINLLGLRPKSRHRNRFIESEKSYKARFYLIQC